MSGRRRKGPPSKKEDNIEADDNILPIDEVPGCWAEKTKYKTIETLRTNYPDAFGTEYRPTGKGVIYVDAIMWARSLLFVVDEYGKPLTISSLVRQMVSRVLNDFEQYNARVIVITFDVYDHVPEIKKEVSRSRLSKLPETALDEDFAFANMTLTSALPTQNDIWRFPRLRNKFLRLVSEAFMTFQFPATRVVPNLYAPENAFNSVTDFMQRGFDDPKFAGNRVLIVNGTPANSSDNTEFEGVPYVFVESGESGGYPLVGRHKPYRNSIGEGEQIMAYYARTHFNYGFDWHMFVSVDSDLIPLACIMHDQVNGDLVVRKQKGREFTYVYIRTLLKLTTSGNPFYSVWDFLTYLFMNGNDFVRRPTGLTTDYLFEYVRQMADHCEDTSLTTSGPDGLPVPCPIKLRKFVDAAASARGKPVWRKYTDRVKDAYIGRVPLCAEYWRNMAVTTKEAAATATSTNHVVPTSE